MTTQYFGDDFGQKIDLTVRLREILRNYPEGTSILKELLQNADDAGAREVRFCLDHRSHGTETVAFEGLKGFQGPALLVYNDAVFTDTDFQSIQRIGDSLKRDSSRGVKTGRFGIGFNSVYHLTDLPAFVSGKYMVLFDPQALHLPNVNPSNPGKMIDFVQHNQLASQFPHQFLPFQAFGCSFQTDFKGTLFRFSLRTPAQARTSRLSHSTHSIDSVTDLLKQLKCEAESLLLFQKNIEAISVYHWFRDAAAPEKVFEARILNVNDELRKKRSFMSYCISKPDKTFSCGCEYDLCIEKKDYALSSQPVAQPSEGQRKEQEFANATEEQRWIVSNQFGGGKASQLAFDPKYAELSLIPWGGVASQILAKGRVPESESLTKSRESGRAFCFLPLPVMTSLPVQVNGYFELSSNRRDIWFGEDMDGYGKLRSDWNSALITDIIAPCYIRLLLKYTQILTNAEHTDYYGLWPSGAAGPWLKLQTEVYRLSIALPLLPIFSHLSTPSWAKPQDGILVESKNFEDAHDAEERSDGDQQKLLATILSEESLRPFLLPGALYQQFFALGSSSLQFLNPAIVRTHFKSPKANFPSLRSDRKHVKCLLDYCLSDWKDGPVHRKQGTAQVNDEVYWSELSGLHLLPLATGDVTRFFVVSKEEAQHLPFLEGMGFTRSQCLKALSKAGGNANTAASLLLNGEVAAQTSSSTAAHANETYLLCSQQEFTLLSPGDIFSTSSASVSAPNKALTHLLDRSALTSRVENIFRSPSFTKCTTNIQTFNPFQHLSILLPQLLPPSWIGQEEVNWDVEAPLTVTSSTTLLAPSSPSSYARRTWVQLLWEYICNHEAGELLGANRESLTRGGDSEGRGKALTALLRSIAESQCPILPTNEKKLVALSNPSSGGPSSSRIISGELLSDTLIQVLQKLNLGTVLSGLFANCRHADEIFLFIQQPTASGILSALMAEIKRQDSVESKHPLEDRLSHFIKSKLTDNDIDTLRGFLLRGLDQDASPDDLSLVASLPIFPLASPSCFVSNSAAEKPGELTYDSKGLPLAEDESNEAKETVSGSHREFGSLRGRYLLEEAVDTRLLTEEFLQFSDDIEESLVRKLFRSEIATVSHVDFYLSHVFSRVETYSSDIRNDVMMTILLQLPRFCAKDPRIKDALSVCRFVPVRKRLPDEAVEDVSQSEEPKLRAPAELFDPDVDDIVDLLDLEDFPDAPFNAAEPLIALRSLGIHTSIPRAVILKYARKIEQMALSLTLFQEPDNPASTVNAASANPNFRPLSPPTLLPPSPQSKSADLAILPGQLTAPISSSVGAEEDDGGEETPSSPEDIKRKSMSLLRYLDVHSTRLFLVAAELSENRVSPRSLRSYNTSSLSSTDRPNPSSSYNSLSQSRSRSRDGGGAMRFFSRFVKKAIGDQTSNDSYYTTSDHQAQEERRRERQRREEEVERESSRKRREEQKAEEEAEIESFVTQLYSIQWCPVVSRLSDPILVPRQARGEAETQILVAFPDKVRPQEDEWFCSSSFSLLDGNVFSTTLRNAMKWDTPLPVTVLAHQLKSLAQNYLAEIEGLKQSCDTVNDVARGNGEVEKRQKSLQQVISTVVPRLYQILMMGLINESGPSRRDRYRINTPLDDVARQGQEKEEAVREILHESKWIWVGNAFVSADSLAFSGATDARPYLFSVPHELSCFSSLLLSMGVRKEFAPTDYLRVLRQIYEENIQSASSSEVRPDIKNLGLALRSRPLSPPTLQLALTLLQYVSDHVTRVEDWEIYGPDADDCMAPTRELVYDDAHWLSGGLENTLSSSVSTVGPSSSRGMSARMVHGKISNTVAERIGAKSLRKLIMEKSSVSLFPAVDIEVEAFGQAEPLTRRLRHILELYPEGPSILYELIQNADDAGARTFQILLNTTQYPENSLLSPSMASWQGPALYIANDALFTESDLQNLSRIGQGSKLDKLASTGRFGLGFNAVYHFTDMPMFVSGDNMVILDPHAKYVPGATIVNPGVRMRLRETKLVEQFPDQFSPLNGILGCDFSTNGTSQGQGTSHFYDGTLFRFPFRRTRHARESEIKQNETTIESIQEMLSAFIEKLPQAFVFLRNITKIEVFTLKQENATGDSVARPRLLCSATANVTAPQRSLLQSFISGGPEDSASEPKPDPKSSGRRAATEGVKTDKRFRSVTKGDFYAKLAQTPASKLPVSFEVIKVIMEEIPVLDSNVEQALLVSGSEAKQALASNADNQGRVLRETTFLICNMIGAGDVRTFACQESTKNANLKLLPLGGVAVELDRKRKGGVCSDGHAFCFLPLPVDTGLPVHVNAYFELSSNRRDVWFGEDMAGDGRQKSQWNYLLLRDVVSVAYAKLIEQIAINRHLFLCPSPPSPSSSSSSPTSAFHSLSKEQISDLSEGFYQIWPTELKTKPWAVVTKQLYANLTASKIISTFDHALVAPKETLFVTSDGSLGPTTTSLESVHQTSTDGERSSGDEAGYSSSVEEKVRRLLRREGQHIAVMPRNLLDLFLELTSDVKEMTPQAVREYYQTAGRISIQNKLQESNLGSQSVSCEEASVLLQYCLSDITATSAFWSELDNLRLVPLVSGELGDIHVTSSALGAPATGFIYMCEGTEFELLKEKLAYSLIDLSLVHGFKHHLDLLSSWERTNIRKMGIDLFFSCLPALLPPSWRKNQPAIKEVEWTPAISNAAQSTTTSPALSPPPHPSEHWIGLFWAYVFQRGLVDKVAQGGWPLLPTYSHDERYLVSLSSALSRSLPSSRVIAPETLPMDVRAVMSSLGGRLLDISMQEGPSLASVLFEKRFVEQGTARGVLNVLRTVLISSFVSPSSTSHQTWVEGKFAPFSADQRSSLRHFLSQLDKVKSHSLSEEDSSLLKCLPIYDVYDESANSSGLLSNTVRKFASLATLDKAEDTKLHWLPPSTIDSRLLTSDYLKIIHPSDSALFSALSVPRMKASDFYIQSAFSRLSVLPSDVRTVSVQQMLFALPELIKEKPDFVQVLLSTPLIPSRREAYSSSGSTTSATEQTLISGIHLHTINSLFDPTIPRLKIFLEAESFPAEAFCSSNMLVILRSLGLQTSLSRSGLLQSASTVARLAQTDRELARQRGMEILKYLEEQNVEAENDGSNEVTPTEISSHAQTETARSSGGTMPKKEFLERLRAISWLPVLVQPPNVNLPWPGETLAFAPPALTRSKEDMWLCSGKYRIYQGPAISPRLTNLLGWTGHLPIDVLTSQLVELGHTYRSHGGSGFRHVLSSVLPLIYEALNNHPDVEKTPNLLGDAEWIWVDEELFVSIDQVALSAPENAKPYLFHLPEEIQRHEKLIKQFRVREEFSTRDLADVLAKLPRDQPLSESKLDFAVNIAILLGQKLQTSSSTASPSEQSLSSVSCFLPSKSSHMRLASELIYDDAPWLGDETTRALYPLSTYVDDRISSSLCQALGARSFRQVVLDEFQHRGIDQLHCNDAVAISRHLEIYRENKNVLCDILEVAELFECRKVEVIFDQRVHPKQSLFDERLGDLQGPSLCIVLRDCIVSTEDIVHATSISSFSAARSLADRRGGKFGPGLSSAFRLTDCLQILSGNNFHLFDPCGTFLADNDQQSSTAPMHGRTNARRLSDSIATPIAQKFDLKGTDLIQKFSNQFSPLLECSGSANDNRRSRYQSAYSQYIFPGTVIRLPLRARDSPLGPAMSPTTSGISATISSFLEGLPATVLFTVHLETVEVRQWDAAPAGEGAQPPSEPALVASASLPVPPPEIYRENRGKTKLNQEWKRTKLTSLLFKNSSVVKNNYEIDLIVMGRETLSGLPTVSSLSEAEKKDGEVDSKGEMKVHVDTWKIFDSMGDGTTRETALSRTTENLRLLPYACVAAHIARDGQPLPASEGSQPCTQWKGRICATFPSSIDTGLPVYIDGGFLLFPRERGLADKDEEDIPSFAKDDIRTRWNRELFCESVCPLYGELLLSILKEIGQRRRFPDPKYLYRFWPASKNIQGPLLSYITSSLYPRLSQLPIYLSASGVFAPLTEGYLREAEIPAVVEHFLLKSRFPLLEIPPQICEDFRRSPSIAIKVLTPSAMRQILRGFTSFNGGTALRRMPGSALNAQHQSFFATEAMGSEVISLSEDMGVELLAYCLSDANEELFDQQQRDGNHEAVLNYWREFKGLAILPLITGSVAEFGARRPVILATANQIALLPPSYRHTFLSLKAVNKLPILKNAMMKQMANITDFNVRWLAQTFNSALPATWKNAEVVPWEPSASTPSLAPPSATITTSTLIVPEDDFLSEMWLYRFWREVSFSDPEHMALFSPWPLIPVTNGKLLVSCSLATLVLCVWSGAIDDVKERHFREVFEQSVHSAGQTSRSRAISENALRALADASRFSDESSDESAHASDNLAQVVQGATTEENTDPPISSEVVSLSNNGAPVAAAETRVSVTLTTEMMAQLYVILYKLEIPLLDLTFFPQREALLMNRQRLASYVLQSLDKFLGVSLSPQPTAAAATVGSEPLSWTDKLDANEMEDLLQFFAKQSASVGGYSQSEREKIQRLPLFELLNGKYMALKVITEGLRRDSDRERRETRRRREVGLTEVYMTAGDVLDPSLQALPVFSTLPIVKEKPELRSFYSDLGIQPLTEVELVTKFLLPVYGQRREESRSAFSFRSSQNSEAQELKMSSEERWRIFMLLRDKWARLKTDERLVETLKNTPLVETSAGALKCAKEMLDHRNAMLVSLLGVSESSATVMTADLLILQSSSSTDPWREGDFFLPEKYREPSTLAMLGDLGLKSDLDTELFLACARRLESQYTNLLSLPRGMEVHGEENDRRQARLTEAASKATQLLRYLYDRLHQLYSPHFCREIAKVAFVPMHRPVECSSAMSSPSSPPSIILKKFSEGALPKDRPLVWTTYPIMVEEVVPPHMMQDYLGIVSPPPLPPVLAHIYSICQYSLASDLPVSGTNPAAPHRKLGTILGPWKDVARQFKVSEVFQKIFTFLEDSWEVIPEAERERIKGLTLIPIGDHMLAKPSQVFFRLQEDLSPFLFEIPRVFGSRDRLFRKLGTQESPSSEHYQFFLRQVYADTKQQPLNPNEFSAVLKLLRLLVEDPSFSVDSIGDVQNSTTILNTGQRRSRVREMFSRGRSSAQVDISRDDSSASSGSKSIYVPDQSFILREYTQCVTNDAPWILSQIRLDDLFVTSNLVSRSVCEKLRIPSLSSVVQESLSTEEIANLQALRGEYQQEVLSALESKLSGLLGKEEVLKALKHVSRFMNTSSSPARAGEEPVAAAKTSQILQELSAYRVEFVPRIPLQFTRTTSDGTVVRVETSSIDVMSPCSHATPYFCDRERRRFLLATESMDIPELRETERSELSRLCMRPTYAMARLVDQFFGEALDVGLLESILSAGIAGTETSTIQSTAVADRMFQVLNVHRVAEDPMAATHRARGVPGYPLIEEDLYGDIPPDSSAVKAAERNNHEDIALLLELRPAGGFYAGECVAWRDENQILRYGTVISVINQEEHGDPSVASGGPLPMIPTIQVQIAPDARRTFLATDVFAFRSRRGLDAKEQVRDVTTSLASAAQLSTSSSVSRVAAGALVPSTTVHTRPQASGNSSQAQAAVALPSDATQPRRRESSSDARHLLLPDINHSALGNLGTGQRNLVLDACESLLSSVQLSLQADHRELMSDVLKTRSENDRLQNSLRHLTTEIQSVRDERDQLKSAFQCQICYVRDVDKVLIPCGHLVCSPCLSQISGSGRIPNCPFCRLRFTQHASFFRPT